MHTVRRPDQGVLYCKPHTEREWACQIIGTRQATALWSSAYKNQLHVQEILYQTSISSSLATFYLSNTVHLVDASPAFLYARPALCSASSLLECSEW